jgi:putative CocE/NonD family hydrolase
MSYTTSPIAEVIEVTGHPIVRVWITSTAPDVDVVAYLEDVDGAGRSHYVTEGVLRASHRALADPPLMYLGLPYHRGFAADLRDLPAEPAELVFDLLPTSIVFDVGHRIRLTITGADCDNLLVRQTEPRPTLQIHRGAAYASSVVLPVIPLSATRSVIAAPWERPIVSRTALAAVAALAAIGACILMVGGLSSNWRQNAMRQIRTSSASH